MLTILLLCLPLRVQNEAKAVQLPPQVRSLAQLAGELSAQGVKVQCDTTIASRLALVCVRDRAWNSLRPLLEQGLEVRFIQKPEGMWTLTADPNAALREKALRDHFFMRYQKGIDDILTPARKTADEMHRMNKEEHALKDAELRAIIGVPGGPSGTPAQKQLAALILQLDFYGEGGLWPLLKPLNLAALLQEPIGHTDHIPNVAQDNSEAGARIRASLQSNFRFRNISIEAFDLSESLRFHPLLFSLTESMSGANESNESNYIAMGHLKLVPGTINILPFTLRDIFAETGQDKALAASEQATNAWLSKVSGDKPITLDASERTLSATVQKWSEQNEREVIMEVSPQRDVLPGFNMITPKITLHMARALQSGHPPQEDELADGLSFNEQHQAAQRYLDATPSVDRTPFDINILVWTAAQVDTVALIHNQLAFLDNMAVRNPAAAVLLTQRRDQHDDHLLTLDDLLASSRLLSARDNTLAADSSLYRGLGNYAGVYPLLRLLDTYPQRETLQKELAKSGAAHLECRRCTLTALNTLTNALRSLAALGPASGYTVKCVRPDFPLWVRQGVLDIVTEPSELGKGVWMTFTLYKSSGAGVGKAQEETDALWQATVGPLRNPQVVADGKAIH